VEKIPAYRYIWAGGIGDGIGEEGGLTYGTENCVMRDRERKKERKKKKKKKREKGIQSVCSSGTR
jgi:hypothetical protein